MSFGLNGNFFTWILQFYYMIQLIQIVIGKNYKGEELNINNLGVFLDPLVL